MISRLPFTVPFPFVWVDLPCWIRSYRVCTVTAITHTRFAWFGFCTDRTTPAVLHTWDLPPAVYAPRLVDLPAGLLHR